MAVRFPFGHGLSYTTFAYDNLQLSTKVSDLSADVEVSVDITNTGDAAGAETVQLYVGCSQPDRPVRELKGFGKVFLNPGETGTVRFRLNMRSFAYYHESAGCWHVRNGMYTVDIGASSRDIRCRESIEIRDQAKPKVKITEETAFVEILENPSLREDMMAFLTKGNSDEAKKMEEGKPANPMAVCIPLRAVKSLSRGAITQAELNEFVAHCNQVIGIDE